jgi:hypothetical protein
MSACLSFISTPGARKVRPKHRFGRIYERAVGAGDLG